MNRITLVNNTLEELRHSIEQAEELASKPSMSPSEVRLHATLLAKISLLKQGVTPDEIRRATMERLAKEVGLESPEENRTRDMSTSEARDWQDFADYGEKRTNYQSTAQWGLPSGASYDGGAGSGSQGGVLVPPGFQSNLFLASATIDEILADDNSNVWESDNGAAATTPAIDDTGTSSPVAFTKATIVNETVQNVVKPVRFRAVNWSKTPTYRSGIILVDYEIEQDSFQPWATMLQKVFAQRLALGFGADCISGSGVAASGGVSTVPQGLLTAIPASAQTTSASSTLAITDLENLYNALPKVFRPNAKFYMTDNTRLQVHKLFESTTRSGWGFDGELLFARKVVVCHSMSDFAPGVQNAIVFADPSYLMQRRVKNGSYVRRYTQTPNYVEAGLFGYECFTRADFRPVLFDAYQPPVAALNAHV